MQDPAPFFSMQMAFDPQGDGLQGWIGSFTRRIGKRKIYSRERSGYVYHALETEKRKDFENENTMFRELK